jgi:hypothetical protein
MTLAHLSRCQNDEIPALRARKETRHVKSRAVSILVDSTEIKHFTVKTAPSMQQIHAFFLLHNNKIALARRGRSRSNQP